MKHTTNQSRISFPQSPVPTRGLAARRLVQPLANGILIAAASLLTSPQLHAQWPQILGPDRNGNVELDTPLAPQWPSSPEIGWQVDLGSGFSGAAITGDRVLAFHRQDDREILQAISLRTGESEWSSSWPATYQARVNPDAGPRCVPTIDQDRVVCYGAAGDLACIRLDDGELLWRRALRQEYDADDGYFGAGASPLAVEDLIITCVGGRQGGVVAVDRETGKTRWTATEYDASYASPIAIPTAGENYILAVMRLNTVLLRTADGQVLSSVDFGSRGPTVNAATPIPIGDQRFLLTASYGVGGLTLAVDNNDLHEIDRGDWLSSQYNTPVLVNEHLVIGIDGREDLGVASLRAIDPQNQQVLWEQADFGPSHLLATPDNVLALGVEGHLRLIAKSADAYRLQADMRLPEGVYRSLPAMQDHQLIVRRSLPSGDSQLLRVDLP